MPSRMIKVLNEWHFNLLGDKTVGFDQKKEKINYS
jgi:hypothetical protein